MKNKILFGLCALTLLASPAFAAETVTVEDAGLSAAAAAAPVVMETSLSQPLNLDVTWKDFVNDDLPTLQLKGVEPAVGSKVSSNVIQDEGFTLSLSDAVRMPNEKQKFELSYSTRRNFSLRTKNSGLMLTKRFKFEPQRAADTLPDTGFDIGKPQFSQ